MHKTKRVNKRKNLRQIGGTYYYRVYVWNSQTSRESEVAIMLKTKSRAEALRRGKKVEAVEEDI